MGSYITRARTTIYRIGLIIFNTIVMCHEENVFNKVLEKLYPKLNKFFHKRIRGLTDKPDNAINKDDLIQKAALLAWETWHAKGEILQSHEEIEKLVFFKARTIWLNFFKGRDRRNDSLDAILEIRGMGDTHLLYREEVEHLRKTTKPLQYEVLMLHADGFKYEEISTLTGLTVGTIKMLVLRERIRRRKGGENL